MAGTNTSCLAQVFKGGCGIVHCPASSFFVFHTSSQSGGERMKMHSCESFKTLEEVGASRKNTSFNISVNVCSWTRMFF